MRFMKIGKQKGATSIYEVAPLLCVLSLPLFDQITDLRGKFCVVLISAAFAGLDKGVKCFCGSKEQSAIRTSGKMLHDTIPNSTLENLPGFRHGDLNLNYPEQYAQMIGNFAS